MKVLKIFLLLLLISINIQAQTSQQKSDSIPHLFKQFSKNGRGAQSVAADGDYLVMVSNFVAKVVLYNLKHKKLLYTQYLPPKKVMRGKLDIYHANNSSFGNAKYEESDFFPLLYVSHRENDERRGITEVYRITPIKTDSTKVDFDSINVSLVQTIFYPPMTDGNAMGSPWTVIDREENFMYTYSRNNRSKAPNKGKCRISKFKIPEVKDNDSVYLSDKDILDTYEVDFNAPLSQGACIHRGKLYIAQGISPKKSNVWLRVVDLKEKKLERSFNLKASGFPVEPEGCFIYKGKLMLTTASKMIFEMNIPID